MSRTDTSSATSRDETTVEKYVLGVRIVKCANRDSDTVHYRFEAPEHEAVAFEDPDLARLYADVYFDANGFVEAGTGERGIPPELVQAGKDTLAAYLLTQSGTDVNWVASFYGTRPEKVERYVSWVRDRATEVRQKVKAHEAE